jgi:hypothetical protein
VRLVDYPFVVVRVGCNLCHRKGSYRLLRLGIAFGADATLEEVMEGLAKNCPWRAQPWERSRNQYRPKCHARFIDLDKPTPPDLPPAMAGLRVIEGGKSDELKPAAKPSRRRKRAAE